MKNFDFGTAIQEIKDGKRLTRESWNDKDTYLLLMNGKCVTEQINDCYGDPNRHENGQSIPVLDAIYLKTADNKLVPYVASQTDMLSEDWQIV